MPVVGFVSGGDPVSEHLIRAFRQGLNDLGYYEDQNVQIEYRWAFGRYDQLQVLTAELVSRKVAVIAAVGGIPSALAAKATTSTIPIVFSIAGDPVRFGLVESFNRPGRNATGVSFLSSELNVKRLELAREILPTARTIALLMNPLNQNAEPDAQALRSSALASDVEIQILRVSTLDELRSTFDILAQHPIDALIIHADPLFFENRDHLLALIGRLAIPTVHYSREFVVAGGLISYGQDFTDTYHQIGIYTARILHGDKPADLPVQQAAKFEMVINLETAKALGITFPLALLGRADEVIE
jgi:putative tryptophan/tyrosine transport system substrate-binding protein